MLPSSHDFCIRSTFRGFHPKVAFLSWMLLKVSTHGRAGQGARPDAGFCGDVAAARGGAGGWFCAVRSRAWPSFIASCANGSPPKPAPAACCRGYRSHSASASLSISPRIMSRFLPVAAVAAAGFCAAAFLLRRQKLFPVAVMIAADRGGLRHRDMENRSRSRTACWRGRCIRCRCRASSRPATCASAPTGSCCGSPDGAPRARN